MFSRSHVDRPYAIIVHKMSCCDDITFLSYTENIRFGEIISSPSQLTMKILFIDFMAAILNFT